MSTPIALHETNPHYFSYHGKPLLLVASAEHYGAVLNGAFDFGKYLRELKRCGNNLTRTFVGVQREFPGSFYDAFNTLAPKPADFLCPYARSDVKGANDAQNKFDLDRWDEAFFSRLEDFLREAGNNDVIVELAFFCPFYREMLGNATWNLSPYHPDNNVNGVGAAGLQKVYAWEDEAFVRYESALIRRIVTLLNPFDNLMYEIMNEPYFGEVTEAFQPAVARLVAETECALPKKHLITQNVANFTSKIENPDPFVSVFNYHYASPPTAVAENQALGRPIGCNETGFAQDNLDETFRRQAWEFLLAGGALFNNLDFSFAAGNESGDGPSQCPHTGGSHALRMQLGFLRSFLEEMDFTRLCPANELIARGSGEEPRGYLLAEPGRQYAYYRKAEALPESVALSLEPGEYRWEAVDPEKRLPVACGSFRHEGGAWSLPLGRELLGAEIAVRLARLPRL